MYSPYPGSAPRRSVGPWILVGVVFLLVLLVALYVLYGAPGAATGGRPYVGYYGGGLILVIFLILLGLMAVRMALWRGLRGGFGRGLGGGRGRPDPAMRAARQRYARGEITREQFKQIMVDLGRGPRGP